MDKKFKQAYAGLNDEQRQAVDKIDGPILVIAGPGTGKTQLLATRVANILRTTDTKSANILCLTFTNKAAVNMKSRIIELTGPEGAKVNASTFHSFAGEIMNLYPDRFWNAARLSVAPDTVQLALVESIVASLPLDNPLALKFAGQYTLLKDIQGAINLTKQAGLTPDKLRAIINANLAYIDILEEPLAEICAGRLSFKALDDFRQRIQALPTQEIDDYIYPLTSLSTVIAESLDTAIEADRPTGKCTNTSRFKNRWVQTVEGRRGMFKERERNDWWLKLADVYEHYRDGLHQKGFYDYADMLVEVISQLEQSPDMLADIQERFNYVLIDEFQDTTPAQLRLAHLTADHHSAEGNPNLMAVGDDDQTIFKFSGAELNNMLGFKRTYPATKIIVLTKSYRSTQSLLDVSRKIIDQASNRLVSQDSSLDKKLVAEDPPAAGHIRAISYASRELQLSLVAEDIKRNYTRNRDIAVLARGHDSLVRLAALLQQIEVPVRYEQASDIMDHPIIEQVYLIIRLVLAIQAGERDSCNGLLHKIVRWPAWQLEPRQLWQLALANSGRGDWLGSLSKSSKPALREMANWFMWLAANADSQPLAVTIEQIIGLRESDHYRSPVRDYFLASKSDINGYFHGLSAIQLLRSLVHEFAAGSEPNLADLARFVEINKQNGVTVADESPFISGVDGVQLLSVHKAKGLEFNHVYIIDAIEDNWKPRSGGRKPPANLPLQPPGDDFDDYVRLMYVAATRAKASLTFTCYHQDHAGRDVAPATILQGVLPIETAYEDDPEKLISVLEQNLAWPALSGGQEREMLKARLETYSLSVTHLQNFLDISRGGPQYFKERNLLRLPEVKTPSLSYGTAMHEALDRAQKLTNQAGFDLAKVLDSFGASLKAEQISPVDYERYLAKGRQTLTRLFDKFDFVLLAGSSSEQNFKDISLGTARIGGKLDRVDRTGGKIIISDYKTGSPLASFATTDKNKAIKAYKHRMQLVFYALMAQEALSAKPGQIEGQMIYIDADTRRSLVLNYTPTQQDIDKLKRLIEVVWPRIIKLDFPDTSQYSADIDGIKAFEADLLK